jgi:hypothetical protein
MTHRTSTRSAGLAAALLASLVFTSVANARPAEFSQHRNVEPQVTISVPDRVDKLGVIGQGGIAVQSGSITSSVPTVPDRTDLLGTSRGPQLVQVPTATASAEGLSWTYGAIGAAFLLAASLLVAYAVKSAGGRRRGGLPLPS